MYVRGKESERTKVSILLHLTYLRAKKDIQQGGGKMEKKDGLDFLTLGID